MSTFWGVAMWAKRIDFCYSCWNLMAIRNYHYADDPFNQNRIFKI
jgi:hypothetical protein